MTIRTDLPRLETGVRNLDAVFRGGMPAGTVTVVAGAPGSGKTILAQQICFHNASATRRVLYFSTLSEPTAKTLRYLKQFTFFDAAKLHDAVRFVDLGVILRTKTLEEIAALIMAQIKKTRPALVVIDSFKVFDDLATSREALRKFGYELAVNLMAWETTALLLGEYGPDEYEHNPLFSIVDGLLVLSQREAAGEHQRFFKIVKMRGTDHSRDEHAFAITPHGIELYVPRVLIRREAVASDAPSRCLTHIPKLDAVLGSGIPWGSSLLIGGVAGTGKTVLSLEFLYRGALAGERGIFFSFEETEARLRATARGLGWDLDREIARGMVEIVFIPQPDIQVEAHLLMIRERVAAAAARRVVVDSLAVFLHKIKDPQLDREKTFHLCSIVQNAQAVGFFTTDIAFGSAHVSRFGVEETVVDGVIILSATEEHLARERYLEVYKLRNTAHLQGRHPFQIAHGGVAIVPRYVAAPRREGARPAPRASARVGSGVPGLDPLLWGGLLARSLTLVSGSAGTGKTTLGVQFVLEGATPRAPGLYITLEETPEQLVARADALGLPLRAAVERGAVEVLGPPREPRRAGQLLSVLADKLRATRARRVVVDAVTEVITARRAPDELRQALHTLTDLLRDFGVTGLLTLEAAALHGSDAVTTRGLSPLADNLLMLRYARAARGLAPTLTVVKTRGSAHDRGTHRIAIGEGGVRIGPPARAPRPRRTRRSAAPEGPERPKRKT